MGLSSKFHEPQVKDLLDTKMDLGITACAFSYLLVIVVNTEETELLAVRNFIIREICKLTITNGTLIGFGYPNPQITELCHIWDRHEVAILFTFDTSLQLRQYLDEMRFRSRFRAGFDIFSFPLINVLRPKENCRYLELTLHDVKYPEEFRNYVSTLPELAEKNGGTLAAATKSVRVYDGARVPNYIVVSQWNSENAFLDYVQDLNRQLNGEKYACTARTLLEIRPE
ncbi:unnamed protein product [Calicophoron daubneyi]|uniref:ABM domain-containing protein n=1 Tax=Calicophoron daubneyi TaxID=300641 RepID=A0AAV2TUV2_CALDB